MQLIYLAAGLGSRLGNKTKNVPKCCVKVNGKPIISYVSKIFKKFDNVLIIGGHKSNQILKYIEINNKIKLIKNKNYKNTNMVYSLMLAKKYLLKNNDIIICYGDIIFDLDLIKLVWKNNNCIPLKKDWLNYWKKRMSIKDIKNDAENLVTRKKHIIEIGTKINNKLPNKQYMGIIKLRFFEFKKINKFFNKIDNKIDMTRFLNLVIKNNIMKFRFLTTTKYWYEIDNKKDIFIAEKELKNKWLYG